MRTLALLTAVLLALQAQAGPLPEKAEETPEQQRQEEEEPDMTISLEGAESSDPQDAAQGEIKTCYCRRQYCVVGECNRGVCRFGGVTHHFCCR